MTRRRSRLPAAAATTVLFAVVALSFYPRETSAHKKFTFTTTHANELEEGFFQGGVESQIKHIFEETLRDKATAAGSSVDKGTIHAKKADPATTPPPFSVEHGIQVFEQLQAMARETVLLHDMNPFPRGARPRAQTIDDLPTFEITDMGALLRQRASTASSGLNIWFQF